MLAHQTDGLAPCCKAVTNDLAEVQAVSLSGSDAPPRPPVAEGSTKSAGDCFCLCNLIGTYKITQISAG
jgi:hypothetical protein